MTDSGRAGKPTLLYLSPVLPALTGNGLAMRAGTVLQLLACHFRVYLLVRPLYPSMDTTLSPLLQSACEKVVVLPGARAEPRGRLAHVLHRPRRPFYRRRYDVVHVFRLAMLPDARPYLAASPTPQRQLDLDDLESRSQRRIAALYREAGDAPRAAMAEALARRAETAEREVLNGWDRVYVCSNVDLWALRQGTEQVHVLPNVVRLPAPLPEPRTGQPFTFLFVGTLGYYPNEDGLRHFCDTVLPILRREAGEPFRVMVAGFGGGPGVTALAKHPEVELAGAVQDVAPCYADADAVIVPVRAGGGTRIKVLEAFAYRRPVVSTVAGCEGLEVQDGEQILVASTDGEMAEACLRLMRDAGLRRHVTHRAAELLCQRYTPEALIAADPQGRRWGLAT